MEAHNVTSSHTQPSPAITSLSKTSRQTLKKSCKGNRLPPFVAMPWELLNSRAYIELNNAAKAALTYFMGKPHMVYASPEYYSVVFRFSYREAKRFAEDAKKNHGINITGNIK